MKAAVPSVWINKAEKSKIDVESIPHMLKPFRRLDKTFNAKIINTGFKIKI